MRGAWHAALALVLASAGPAAGQSADPAEDRPFSPAALGLKGQLIYKGYGYPDTTPNDDQRVRNEGIVELEWARRFAWWNLKLVVDARADDSGDAQRAVRDHRGGAHTAPEQRQLAEALPGLEPTEQDGPAALFLVDGGPARQDPVEAVRVVALAEQDLAQHEQVAAGAGAGGGLDHGGAG